MQFIRLAGHHLGLGGYLQVRQDRKALPVRVSGYGEIKDFGLET